MKVPADLDQLMWLLAESGEEAAISEFKKRFPDLEIELGRRQSIVRGLKLARPDQNSKPIFQPKTLAEPPPEKPKAWLWAGAIASLAVFAFGSYYVTTSVIRAPEPLRKKDLVGAPEGPRPRMEPGDQSKRNPSEPYPGPVTVGPDTVAPVGENQTRPWQVPTSVTLEEAPLYDILARIADQTGMQIEIAPNTPNPTVSAYFEGVTGPDMLRQMGKAYGFTPLEQEPGRFLVIPAVDFMELQ